MTRNGDVMRSDRLKQVMQQIDPNFDERNAGFNRFSKFVVEAGQRGVVRVTKLDNGQYEVAPPAGGIAAGAPAAAARARRAGARGRGRRGARDENGRRGRSAAAAGVGPSARRRTRARRRGAARGRGRGREPRAAANRWLRAAGPRTARSRWRAPSSS